MPFDGHADIGVLLQPGGLALQYLLVLRVDIILVGVDQDAVRRYGGDEILLAALDRAGGSGRPAGMRGSIAAARGRPFLRRLLRPRGTRHDGRSEEPTSALQTLRRNTHN